MTNHTQRGRAYRATKPDLWYFDQLPATHRSALANAMFAWSTGAVYNRWRRNVAGYSERSIALTIAQWDQNTLTRDGKREISAADLWGN